LVGLEVDAVEGADEDVVDGGEFGGDGSVRGWDGRFWVVRGDGEEVHWAAFPREFCGGGVAERHTFLVVVVVVVMMMKRGWTLGDEVRTQGIEWIAIVDEN
jgi:hypothetical protein